ncbi:hypothetical protein [Treponema vincentii]|uniref:hypothetical protein n=1 Tax=Treponema vincentii TaxID=69710 RepID=UPI0020A43899|nr:hypothetical protein [Treponema vincentii]UTC49343.1 hypothetical protein E4N73_11170 [Treponema vincentii]
MKKHCSVYTLDNLADFASFLIFSQINADGASCSTVLDPACGEGSLLKSYAKTINQANSSLIGIDIDYSKDSSMNMKFVGSAYTDHKTGDKPYYKIKTILIDTKWPMENHNRNDKMIEELTLLIESGK